MIRLLSAIVLTLLVTGCANTPKPSVVTEVVTQQNIQVPPVQPPEAFKPATFKFQRPEEPNGVVALDVDNYGQFREFMLGLNKRELEWQNRLGQANSSILLLQGVKETSPNVMVTAPK